SIAARRRPAGILPNSASGVNGVESSGMSDFSQEHAAGGGTRPIRVCSFESRKGDEIRSLIERHGGEATVAPSLREVPLEENPAAFEFADRLLGGSLDVVVFLTGVGARGLLD